MENGNLDQYKEKDSIIMQMVIFIMGNLRTE
jgi:hypothetical protein